MYNAGPRLWTVVFGWVMFFLVFVLSLAAQSDTAMLSGRVLDASGAAISGAQVSLVDIDREHKQTTKSANTGLYVFPDVRPGRYRIQVSAIGFRTVNVTSLTINTQDSIEQNFKMAVGSVSESVTVVANGANVDVSAAVGTMVDSQFVRELPLNGRSFQTLFQLTPGVVITSTNAGEQGQFSVNGQRANANYFTVDGVSANVGIQAGTLGQSAGGALPGMTASGGTNGLVSVDALQEFSIQTSGYAPEFGRTPGAQVSIITRSGTNEFHGDVFDYLRNDVADANDWFANNLRLKRAALRQNDFGGAAGGAIFRNRTFFFFSYEGLRLRQPTTGISQVPSLTARQSAGPASAPFLNAFPLPTGPAGSDDFAPGDYTFSNPSELNSESLRVDHKLKNNINVFARYNRSTSSVSSRGEGGFDALSEIIEVPFKLQTGTAGMTWGIRPTLANDFRFNWSWSSNSSIFVNDSLGGAVPLAGVPLVPAGQNPNTSQFEFSIFAGTNSAFKLGESTRNLQQQLNFVDTLSWQRGNHLVKAGIDYRRLRPQENVSSYSQLDFFDTVAHAAANQLSVALVSAYFGPVNANYENYSVFGQDTWRVKRVTVTYGLRWDYNPTPTGRGANGFQPMIIVNPSDPANFAPAPQGTPLYHATRDNFAPRLGVAYNVRDSGQYAAVVRAGIGMFYDLGNGPTGDTFDRFPFNSFKVFSAPSLPLTPSEAAPPVETTNPPFSFMMAFPSTLRQPYTYHWNLGYEQSLGTSQTVSVGYLGAAGHSLLRQSLINGGQLNPNFSNVFSVNNSGYSKYNALQAQYRRREARRFEILASYTYAHSLDNVSADSQQTTPTINVNPSQDYGASDFDIRHTGSVALDYEPPTPARSALLRAIAGGWGFNTLIIARTRPPVDVLVTRDLGFGFQAYRPDAVAGIPQYIDDSRAPGGHRLNPNAFSVSTEATQGNLARNSLRGFPLFQQDFSIRRSFRLTEKLRLQARVEAFNAFNHPNFASPANVLGVFDGQTLFPQSNFGISQSMFASGSAQGGLGLGAGFSPLYQIGGPRSLQAAIKLEF